MSYGIYVNISGKDYIDCGLIDKPCRSLSFTINNIFNHIDKIYLIASPITQIRHILENPIVIKHSLTVTKYPTSSQNPVITNDFNVTSHWKKVHAFAIFRKIVAPEALALDIQSVNFNVNILTTFSEEWKAPPKKATVGNTSDFQLALSISDSVISSPCHAINLFIRV